MSFVEEFWRRRSVEERVLLHCARPVSDRSAIAGLATLAVDWQRVLDVAVLHQIAPLIYGAVRESPELTSAVPADVMAKMRQALALNIERKQQLAAALESAALWFATRGMRLLAVKGTSLDVQAGEQPWLTSSQDVDVLLSGRRRDLEQDVIDHMFALNKASPPVDVHCERHSDLEMNGLLPIDFAALWDGDRTVRVGAATVHVMSTEHELVCQCVQSFRKRFFRLKSVHEIARLLVERPVDWELVYRRAREWRCAWVVFVALQVVHAATRVEVPADLRRRLGVPLLRASILNRIIARMSYRNLANLYVDRTVRGKRVGRGLLLPYLSQPWSQLWRSTKIVGSQLWRARD